MKRSNKMNTMLSSVAVILAIGCMPYSVASENAFPPELPSVQIIDKKITEDGSMCFDGLQENSCRLSLPAFACTGMADIELRVVPADSVPNMLYAKALGEAYSIETEPTRLNEAATLSYRYDPDTADDPLLLCLGYFDDEQWHYTPAESKDESTHTVVFTLYHFSAYYPAEFANELDAAKHYTAEMAARKVMSEGGGDPKVASRAILDYMANRIGVSQDETVMRTLTEIAQDKDMVKMIDEARKSGKWTETGYRKAIEMYCDKVADYMIKNRTGLKADDGAVLTTGEKAMKKIGDLMGAVDSGSKFLGALAGGDKDQAAKELIGYFSDNTGALGKAMKYTVSGMQNALDVWRAEEVEKAFKVYTEGSEGVIFGYGEIDAFDFDSVWEDMGAASRQLCIDRIAEENAARRLAGMEILNEAEEKFYRNKVKEELRSEFERRVILKERIEHEKKNLDLIFSRLEADDMLDSSKVWYRGFGGAEETLLNRMERMEHLVQRICNDLQIDTVYADAPLTRELDGRVSAYSMSEMIRVYFSAKNMAEAEDALQQYYVKNFDLGIRNEDLAGTYSMTVTIEGLGEQTGTITISPEGNGGKIDWWGNNCTYLFAERTLTFRLYKETVVTKYSEGHFHADVGVDATITIIFNKDNGIISGSGAYYGWYLDENQKPSQGPFEFVMTLEKLN